MALAVLFPHVVDDLLPPLVAEVHVEVGHGHPLRVQKAFEEQGVFQGIDIGDTHAVGGEAGCAAATAGTHHDVVGLGEVDEIPNDEVVVYEPHVLHHGKLVVEPVPGLLPRIGHLLGHTLLAELSEIRPIVHAVRRGEVRQAALAELDLHVAFIGDFHGISKGLLLSGEKAQHLLGGLAVELLRPHAHPILLVHEALGLYAQEHVLSLGILLVGIVDVVGDHSLEAQIIGQLLELGQHHLLLPDAVVLELDIEVLPEHGLEPPGDGVGLLVPALQQVLGDVSRKAGGQADKALAVFRQQIVVDAGLVVEAVDEGLGREAHEVLVADLVLGEEDQVPVIPAQLSVLDKAVPGHIGLHAQDGFDPLLLALPVEVDDAVHDPVIRDGHGGLPQALGPGHQGGDTGRPVQQRVLGVYMQMGKGNGHAIPPQISKDSISYFLL